MYQFSTKEDKRQVGRAWVGWVAATAREKAERQRSEWLCHSQALQWTTFHKA